MLFRSGYSLYFCLFVMFDSRDSNQTARCTTRSYNGPKSQISTFYDYPFLRNARYIHSYFIIEKPYFCIFLVFDSTGGYTNRRCTTRSYNGSKFQISTFYDYPFSRNAKYIHTHIQTSRKRGSNWLEGGVKINLSRNMSVYGFQGIQFLSYVMH